MKKLSILILILISPLFFLTSCTSEYSTGTGDLGPGSSGATPGGSQNMGYIRTLINEGRIPSADNFLVEGIYSEYDLPLDGESSGDILTIRAAAAYAGGSEFPGSGMYVQLGLSSSIDIDSFQRAPLNLSVVVDKSGSMRGGKIASVRTALTRLIDQLDENDILSIVLFNHETEILIEPTAAAAKSILKRMVSTIEAEGTTDIDFGLRKGYDLVRLNSSDDERTDRVILLTDALPNTGNTSPGNFKELVGEGVNEGIGLTAFGAGVDFDQSLMEFIASQKNCNYLFLETDDEIAKVFDDDFEFMVSPLVHNLRVTINSGQRYRCTAAFGFPGEHHTEPSIDVKTVFLSRRRGALMIGFEPLDGMQPIVTNGSLIANISLSYNELNGANRESQLRVMFKGSDIIDNNSSYFEQDGIRLAVALTREVLGMKEACEIYRSNINNRSYARSMLRTLIEYLEEENIELGNNILDDEIALVRKLRENMLEHVYE